MIFGPIEGEVARRAYIPSKKILPRHDFSEPVVPRQPNLNKVKSFIVENLLTLTTIIASESS